MLGEWLRTKAFAWRNSPWGGLTLRPGVPKRPMDRTDVHSIILKSLISNPSTFQHVVDIGPASWFYLAALTEYFPRARFTAVELDPNRRFRDFFTRGQHAEAQVQRARSKGKMAEYLHSDGLLWLRRQSPAKVPTLYTFFFPLVFGGTAKQWGVPQKWVRWAPLLSVCVERLNALDSILIVHADVSEVAETNRILGVSAIWHEVEVPEWGSGKAWALQLKASNYQRLSAKVDGFVVGSAVFVTAGSV